MSAQYDEIVIFQESHILPFTIVTLQQNDILPQKSLESPKKDVQKWAVDEVANWVGSISLSKEYVIYISLVYFLVIIAPGGLSKIFASNDLKLY
jgi:hypothetical protein